VEFLLRFYQRLGEDSFVSAEFPARVSAGAMRPTGLQRQAIFIRRLIGMVDVNSRFSHRKGH
jgi:hypothetical protein